MGFVFAHLPFCVEWWSFARCLSLFNSNRRSNSVHEMRRFLTCGQRCEMLPTPKLHQTRGFGCQMSGYSTRTSFCMVGFAHCLLFLRRALYFCKFCFFVDLDLVDNADCMKTASWGQCAVTLVATLLILLCKFLHPRVVEHTRTATIPPNRLDSGANPKVTPICV